MSQHGKQYDKLKEFILKAKQENRKLVVVRAWNKYAVIYLKRILEKEGYKVEVLERDEKDVHVMKVSW